MHIFLFFSLALSDWTLRSLIGLPLDFFLQVESQGWIFSLLHVGAQSSLHHLLKILFSPHVALASLSKCGGCKSIDVYLGPRSIPLVNVSVFVSIPWWFFSFLWLYNITSGVTIPLTVVLSFRVVVAVLGPLCFHIHFLSNVCEELYWNFDGSDFESTNWFWWDGHVTVLILSIHEYSSSFCHLVSSSVSSVFYSFTPSYFFLSFILFEATVNGIVSSIPFQCVCFGCVGR